MPEGGEKFIKRKNRQENESKKGADKALFANFECIFSGKGTFSNI
jgi:hypothetical protein